jgi:hypothetical protein
VTRFLAFYIYKIRFTRFSLHKKLKMIFDDTCIHEDANPSNDADFNPSPTTASKEEVPMRAIHRR